MSMTLQRIGTKLFVAERSPVEAAAFIPVFQRWIQRQALPGLLIDVADYGHTHHGPGIMLIGNEGDLNLDFGAGRPGLLYMRKREHAPALAEGLAHCVHQCLLAANLLQREDSLPGLRIEPGETEVVLADRLRAPNTAESFAAQRAELAMFAYRLYGDAGLSQVSEDARENLRVAVRATGEHSLESLLGRTAPVARP